MKTFNLYKTINDITPKNYNDFSFQNKTITVSTTSDFYYLDSENAKILLMKEELNDSGKDDRSIEIYDDFCEWDGNKVILELKISIDKPNNFFGNDNYAPDNAVIGVGLEWKGEKSKLRFCKKLGIIRKGYPFNVKEKIKIDNFFGNTNFKLKFYISEIDNEYSGINLANKQGAIIGSYDLFKIQIEGESSLFPIKEKNDKNAPLWTVEVDYEDIYLDDFNDENVAIVINKSNPAYQYIQESNKFYNEYFQAEVISSAFATLIMEIMKKEDFKIDYKKSCENGTIAQALRYFKEKLDMKIDSDYATLVDSIKKFFAKGLKL